MFPMTWRTDKQYCWLSPLPDAGPPPRCRRWGPRAASSWSRVLADLRLRGTSPSAARPRPRTPPRPPRPLSWPSWPRLRTQSHVISLGQLGTEYQVIPRTSSLNWAFNGSSENSFSTLQEKHVLGDFYLFTRICRKFLMKKVFPIKIKQIWAE